MKLLFALPVLALAGASLAGCQSEAQMKQAFRDQYMTSCRQQFQQRAGEMGGLNADQYCTCNADRLLAAHSVRDLAGNQAAAWAEDTARQCAMEGLGLGNTAAPAAPPAAPAGGNSAAE
jgi:hypothetical protein